MAPCPVHSASCSREGTSGASSPAEFLLGAEDCSLLSASPCGAACCWLALGFSCFARSCSLTADSSSAVLASSSSCRMASWSFSAKSAIFLPLSGSLSMNFLGEKETLIYAPLRPAPPVPAPRSPVGQQPPLPPQHLPQLGQAPAPQAARRRHARRFRAPLGAAILAEATAGRQGQAWEEGEGGAKRSALPCSACWPSNASRCPPAGCLSAGCTRGAAFRVLLQFLFLRGV